MKRWLYRLHIFCRLPSEDRVNLVTAWLLLLSLPGVCRLVGVRACLRWMRWMVGRQPLPASSAPCLADWVDHQGVLVSWAARYCPQSPTCLIRALVLWFLLARRGITCDLRLGIEKDARTFEAHAWVEWCGKPVMESPDVRQRYAVFDTPLNVS